MEHVTGSSWRWSILPLCLRLVIYRLDRDHISTAMFRNDHCNHSLLLDCCFWLHVCRFDRAPCIHLQVGDYWLCHSRWSSFTTMFMQIQDSAGEKCPPGDEETDESRQTCIGQPGKATNRSWKWRSAKIQSVRKRRFQRASSWLSKTYPWRWCWVYPWACWATLSGAPDPRPGRTHWGSCQTRAPCWHTSWSVDI